MLIAELFCLIKQVLAQQVPLDLDHLADHILVSRVIVLAQLIFFLNLFDDAIAAFLPPFGPLSKLAIVADALSRLLCAIVRAAATRASSHIEHRCFLRPSAL